MTQSKLNNKDKGNTDVLYAIVAALAISVAATMQFKKYVNMPTPMMDWVAASVFVLFLLGLIIKAMFRK